MTYKSIADSQFDEAKRLLGEWGKWAVTETGVPACRTNMREVISSKIGGVVSMPCIDDETAMRVDEAVASLREDDLAAFKCVVRHFVPPVMCYADIANELNTSLRSVEARMSIAISRVASAFHETAHMGLAWIYFIQPVGGGPVKIGRSANLKNRLRDLQRGHPEKLQVVAKFLGTREAETYLHQSLAGYRLHGEWFIASGMVAEVIRRVRAGLYDDLKDQLRAA